MNPINEDIKSRNFSRVYLLYGEEDFLRSRNGKRLADAVVSPEDSMNRTVFSGKDANADKIISLSETLPFLSDLRLILVEDSGFFKNAADEALVEYMSHIPESTVIIFSESEVDRKRKLYKAVQKYGKPVAFDPPKGEELISWIGGYFSENGKKIRKQTAGALLDRVGADMNMLKNEMDKLISFSGENEEITPEDVKSICSVNIESSIFAMIDDIAMGRQKKALDRYYELVLLKEAPMRILFLLSREFNLLLISKELEKSGLSRREKAGIMKVPDFAVGKYSAASERFSVKEITAAIEDCVSTENDIKKGRINDRLGTELLIIKYSGRKEGAVVA